MLSCVGMDTLAAPASVAASLRDTPLTVHEIFFSIQGESTHVGRPCLFVRLTGCPLRCAWCDTEYAFHEGAETTVGGVLDRLAQWPCRLVEVTGGEPLAQKGAVPLMEALLAAGYEVLLETSGAIALDRVPPAVVKIMDVKCPGSGEEKRNRLENLHVLTPRDEVKFVIADEADYRWAVEFCAVHRVAERWATLYSPVHGRLRPETLAAWILRDGLRVRLQVQLHKYLWGEHTRGV